MSATAGDPPRAEPAGDDPATGAGPRRRGPSRRTLLVGGAVVVVGGAGAGAALLSRPDEPPAPVDPPDPGPTTTAGPPAEAPLRAVLAEAEATAGLRMLGSPWARWAGRPDGSEGEEASGWDGLYVSWLLRAHGGDPAATAPADLMALVRTSGQVGVEPVPGALVFSDRGLGDDAVEPEEPARVGMVTAVVGGSVVQALEGDHPASLPHSERFVRRVARPGPGPVLFAMPRYAPDERS